MKKILISLCFLAYGINAQAQEVQTSNPIETIYKSGDQIIRTLSEGDGVVFLFQDDRHQDATEKVAVLFEDRESMVAFFEKALEVQMTKNTDRSNDVTVIMNNSVQNDKNVKIVRWGTKQFATYIYVGEAYTVISKAYLNRLVKKIKSKR